MPLVWHCRSTFTHLVGKSGLTRQKSLQSWFRVMPLVATNHTKPNQTITKNTKPPPKKAYQTKPHQTIPSQTNQTKPYQTKPNHTKPIKETYQTKSYQTKPHHTMQNQTEKKNTKTNWLVLFKVLFAIFCSKCVNKNLIP